MTLAAFGAWAQELAAFQDGFETFAGQMAPTLSYNATIGNNWSDAYIGNFPHFGVGVAVGATMIPVASLSDLFASIADDLSIPAELANLGLPIPAAALSAKLGGFILPFDIGLKGMILPESVTSSLLSAGISADYTLLGGNLRFGIIKSNLLLPDVSIGLGYNRLDGSISMPLGIEGQSFTFGTHTLAVTDPTLQFDWGTDSFDLTLQVSKKILFLEPYVGAGYSLGKSSVKGGIASELLYDGVAITEDNLDAIKTALTAAEIEVPDLSADGFMFGAENTDPVLRVYGGLTFSILVIKFDTMLMYVPANQSLGLTSMIRVQL
jgi:hypothetical protein